ncbi:MAG: hypothetical protein LJE92_07370 [Gammaproteobacteria bacterium]|jgi:hypothetical protein|nr:hypothetical protein [Gammaproteobacteria bacterium]
MQSYHTYAAITLIANTFEILPEIRCKLPNSMIAEWMAQNGIEPEDVLYDRPDVVKAKLIALVKKNRPQTPHAA